MILTAACSGDAVRDRSRERRVDPYRAGELTAGVSRDDLDILPRLRGLDQHAVAEVDRDV